MANDLLNPTEAESETSRAYRNGSFSNTVPPSSSGHELDALMGKAFEEKPVWADLYENVHDLFFPPKLPPLELTSTPIPVVDPMQVKRNPASVAISACINVGLLLVLLYAFRAPIITAINKTAMTNIPVDISAWKPVTPKSGNMGGGGGGGDHDIVDPIKGRAPKIEKDPILKPQVAVNQAPKLPVTPAIDVQPIKLPDNPNMPNFGVTNSPNVTLASNGQGSHLGMGTGSNGGLGSGNGNGFGPGEGGNIGGGLRRVGDGVSAPVPTYTVLAEFSDEARRAKYEGAVTVSLIVDANGNPQNVRVVQPVGMGLDEKAVEAVRQFRFKPAMDKKTGKPVPVPISVLVNFRIY
jgi:TonB family protein